MSTRASLGGIFASIAVLTIGWQAGAAAIPAATSTTLSAPPTSTNAGTTNPTTSGNGTRTLGGSTATPAPASPSAAAGTGTTGTSDTGTVTPTPSIAADKTYTGASTGTPYGAVQVQITVSGGKLTDVTPIHLTDHDGHSVQISNRAAPILRSEVLTSQSASVHTVGGATYTSDGYLTSLQSALDQAGL